MSIKLPHSSKAELETLVSSTNATIKKLNDLICQADTNERDLLLIETLRTTIKAIDHDIRIIDGEKRQLKYRLYCHVNRLEMLNCLEFAQKFRIHRECKEISKRLNACNHDKAIKLKQLRDTEDALEKVSERVSSFNGTALNERFKHIVSVEYNPNIKIINNSTGFRIPYLSPIFCLDALPKQLYSIDFDTPEQDTENEAE